MISRRERMVSVVGALGVLFLLAVLLGSLGVSQRRLVPERAMALFDVELPGPAAPPKPQPKKVVELKPPPIVLPDVVKLPIAAPLPPEIVSLLTEASQRAGVCDLTAPVQASLQANPAVADAVTLLPRDARSVANAVMIWNEAWFPSDEAEAAALISVRDAIVATVDAASPECRKASQTGPRFLTLGDADATVFALGSEDWRWQDLVDTAADQDTTLSRPATGLHARRSSATYNSLRK